MDHLAIVWDVIKNLITLNLSAVQKHEWEIFSRLWIFPICNVFINSIVFLLVSSLQSRKKGERNYEKYANLALSDDINDSVLESKRSA